MEAVTKSIQDVLENIFGQDLARLVVSHGMATRIQKKWRLRYSFFDQRELHYRFHYLKIYTEHVPTMSHFWQQGKYGTYSFGDIFMRKKRIGRLEIEWIKHNNCRVECAIDYVTDRVYVRPNH